MLLRYLLPFAGALLGTSATNIVRHAGDDSPPCGGDTPSDVTVDRQDQIDGTTKTTTVTTCPDGSTETMIVTHKIELSWKIRYVDIHSVHIEIDKEDFILANYNNGKKKNNPPGYYLIETHQLTKGLWDYFAFYYFKYGSVYSHGWNTRKNNICLASNTHLELIHGEIKTGVVEPFKDFFGQNNPEDFYQLCSSDHQDECWIGNDAVNFRNIETVLFTNQRSHCENAIGLYVRLDFLIEHNFLCDKGKKSCDPDADDDDDDEGEPIPNPNPGEGEGEGEGGKKCVDAAGNKVSCKDTLKPLNVLIGGKNIKIGSLTFVLGVDFDISPDDYHEVTPKMLNNGFWLYFKQFYERFQGLQKIGDYNLEHICLGYENGYVLHNFAQRESTTVSAKVEQFTKAGVGSDKFQLCYENECFQNTNGFRQKCAYTINEKACDGEMNLYVRMNVYKAVVALWEEDIQTEIEIIRTEPEETCDDNNEFVIMNEAKDKIQQRIKVANQLNAQLEAEINGLEEKVAAQISEIAQAGQERMESIVHTVKNMATCDFTLDVDGYGVWFTNHVNDSDMDNWFNESDKVIANLLTLKSHNCCVP